MDRVKGGNHIILLVLLEHFFVNIFIPLLGRQPGHRTNLAKKFFHLRFVITGSLRKTRLSSAAVNQLGTYNTISFLNYLDGRHSKIILATR